MASRKTLAEVEAELMDELGEFYADPLGHVMFSYPWDTYEPIQIVRLPKKYRDRFDCEWGPDEWTCNLLDEIGDAVADRNFDGKHPVDPLRASVASGHGIGKSTTSSFVIKWIMDTRPFCQGTVTAVTADQLKAKTWAELSKWHDLSLTKALFKFSAGRGSMVMTHRDHGRKWKVEAQTCREENSEAFAGQHAVNSTSFYLFDEASGIPPKIFEVREGGLTDGEPMTFDFGNPTRRSGFFFENTEGRRKAMHITRNIDSRDVEITNKKFLNDFIDEWGEDSDMAKVRVRGMFPSQASTQFISETVVQKAMTRPDMEASQQLNYPLVLGVDVARFGDDKTIIKPRLGPDARSFKAWRYSGLKVTEVAAKVQEAYEHFKTLGLNVARIFVDEGNMGAGVVDILDDLGYPVTGVNFGDNAFNSRTYRYRVDEMWGEMKDAIDRNLILPTIYTEEGKALETQLTQREFGLDKRQLIRLETKADMKARGLPSPDETDALALTFAEKVIVARHTDVFAAGQNLVKGGDFDPMRGT